MRAFLALLLVLPGCAEDSDVGQACPMQVPEVDEVTQGATSFPAVVEINTEFPCDSLTCASASGRPAYCTKECRSDRGCPTAFACRVVTTAGPLADRKYCVWRSCRAPLECGDVAEYDCIDGYYGPEAPPGLCGPKE
jgi:hypothetical protein